MAASDVILVTINYRLSALGFLTTGDDRIKGENEIDVFCGLLFVIGLEIQKLLESRHISCISSERKGPT